MNNVEKSNGDKSCIYMILVNFNIGLGLIMRGFEIYSERIRG